VTTPAVQVDRPAPAFSLMGHTGTAVAPLADYAGRSVLLLFYPFAFSGICTAELCGIRDDLGSFANDEAQVVAVSCDPWFTLRAFAADRGYDFPLVSDFWPHGEVSRQYGVFDEDEGCAGRGSFLVDAAGVLRWAQVVPDDTARDLAELRSALAAI